MDWLPAVNFANNKLDELLSSAPAKKYAQDIAAQLSPEQQRAVIDKGLNIPNFISVTEGMINDQLEHTFKAGNAPNTIAPGLELRNVTPLQPVYIASHPVVGGDAMKWVGDQIANGAEYPDPTYHWAVVVGNYGHELSGKLGKASEGDVGLVNVYRNMNVFGETDSPATWGKWFKVGYTSFNDNAIRVTGEDIIKTKMPGGKYYDVISNNCQCFANKLVESILDMNSPHQSATPVNVLLGPGGLNITSQGEAKYQGPGAAIQAMQAETPNVKK